MLTLSSLEPFALSNLLIATVLGKLGKLGKRGNLGRTKYKLEKSNAIKRVIKGTRFWFDLSSKAYI